MKNNLLIGGVGAVMFIGGMWWSSAIQAGDSDIVARRGIHWHPELELYIDGEHMDIPSNVGLGAVHNPIHTHEDLPVIHLEFGGVVTRDDIKLKQFFSVWGKDIMEFGDRVRMTVNGEENSSLGEYEMHDGDKIALWYETE